MFMCAIHKINAREMRLKYSMTMMDFTFKRFAIAQDRCAMKLTTDSILLGSWAEGGKRILDIGTGCGILALMMAQRFEMASVLAIDIDAEAVKQAQENVELSPFAERIKTQCTALQNLCVETPFDCIVSNPPFFENSLKNNDQRTTVARHTDALPFSALVKHANRLLSDDGIFSVIVPQESLQSIRVEISVSGLFIHRITEIRTTPNKSPKRCLIACSKQNRNALQRDEILLFDEQGNRTEKYQNLTRDFYLK